MASRYPQAYVDYLVHFHGDRDYFECHELLEQYWKEHPNSVYRVTWVGLIQAAVGMYHYRRGNIPGAVKSLTNSLRNCDKGHLRDLGIEAGLWLERLEGVRAKLQASPSASYQDIDIPLADAQLVERCERRCAELGFRWCGPSELDRDELVHRHTLRDRTDVIAERLKALELRSGGR
ncbi:DUF309 domain-containing protein [Paenibacillus alkalitolerans]|uniref:DUF309 domain-containing protein n=1 Tax=Paenibacillus alkalitolerans TaxID=2799335 RepID=UPI0018F44DDE|nr:DUF309 domain-containing protein [Paenibacillus alkalitolerans]